MVTMLFGRIQIIMTSETITWNPWLGCHKVSTGCEFCQAKEFVRRNTKEFRLPVQKKRAKGKTEKYELNYKVKPGSIIRTCTMSDFFLIEADSMRNEVWQFIHERYDCLFHIVTRRPERIAQCLPENWLAGWENVMISVAIEDTFSAYTKLPILLDLNKYNVKHLGISINPFIEDMDIMSFIGSGFIENVEICGESYYGYDGLAREMRLSWVKKIVEQCKLFNINCDFIATGTRLQLDNNLIISIRQNDQKGLAEFYKLNNLDENAVTNNWDTRAKEITDRVLIEQAHELYVALKRKGKI